MQNAPGRAACKVAKSAKDRADGTTKTHEERAELAGLFSRYPKLLEQRHKTVYTKGIHGSKDRNLRGERYQETGIFVTRLSPPERSAEQ
jgi:hypothetical protein